MKEHGEHTGHHLLLTVSREQQMVAKAAMQSVLLRFPDCGH